MVQNTAERERFFLANPSYLLQRMTREEKAIWKEGSSSTKALVSAQVAERVALKIENSEPVDAAALRNLAARYVDHKDLELKKEAEAAAKAEEAERNQEAEVGPLREGKPLPWFAKPMKPAAIWVTISVFITFLAIAALTLTKIIPETACQGIFTLIAIPFAMYSIAASVSWYLHWGVNGKLMKKKSYVMSVITTIFFIAFISTNDTSNQLWLGLFLVISLASWFGFSHWLLKAEIIIALLTVILLLIWDSSSLAKDMARYESIINNAKMPVTLGNLFLKLAAGFLAWCYQLLGLALDKLKIHWIGLGYLILQPMIFRLYVKARHFTQDLA